MGRDFIRFWQEEDIELLKKSLIIVGESFSDCANCRQLGMDYSTQTKCSQCGVTFKYVTSRMAAGAAGERFHWLRKIRGKRPDLQFIDYDDYMKIINRNKARDIFG